MLDESMRKIELYIAREHSYKLATKANDIHNRILGMRRGLIIGGKTPSLPIVFKSGTVVLNHIRENGLDDIAREYGDIALFIASAYEHYLMTFEIDE